MKNKTQLKLVSVIIILIFMPVVNNKLHAADCILNINSEETGTRKNHESDEANCEPADNEIQKAVTKILSAGSNDKKAADISGDSFKLLSERFKLTEKEIMILKNSRYVIPQKLKFDSYGAAFHEIYQSQMPVFVSADSILQTLFSNNSILLEESEKHLILPVIKQLLENLDKSLVKNRNIFHPRLFADLDIYLSVASSLLLEQELKGHSGQSVKIHELLENIHQAKSMSDVELFGRTRRIDFTQYLPRGHYKEHELQNYFRVYMWLSRLEFNILSRSCRSSHPSDSPDNSQTPEEMTAAVTLARLIHLSKSESLLYKLNLFRSFWVAGREDLPADELFKLSSGWSLKKIDDSKYAALQKKLSGKYQRTVNFHYMPLGTTDLPVITTLLGAGITNDTRAVRNLIDPKIPGRHLISGYDFAYLAGSAGAEKKLTDDFKKYPDFKKAFIDRPLKYDHATDLFGMWWNLMIATTQLPSGRLPLFMSSPDYSDMQLNTSIAALTQLKSASVLMAAQPYDVGGCNIPFGYVEPSVAVYRNIVLMIESQKKMMNQLDGNDQLKFRNFSDQYLRIIKTLIVISEHELKGNKLTQTEQNFFSMIAEIQPASTGGPARYTGWYFDMYYSRLKALADPGVVADIYTSSYENQIAYTAVSQPVIGLFALDNNHFVAGPVAIAAVFNAPLEKRLTQTDVAPYLTSQNKVFQKQITEALKPPLINIGYDGSLFKISGRTPVTGTIMLLGHHRKIIFNSDFQLKDGLWQKAFSVKSDYPEMLYLESGDFQGWYEISPVGDLMLDLTGN